MELKDIVLIGRSFDEYCRIFQLDDSLLSKSRVLDAASGVSSFSAEACARGYDLTPADRIYRLTPKDIEETCINGLKEVSDKMPPVLDLYRWDYFPDLSALLEHREKAYRLFLEDFAIHGTKRYIPTEFPVMPFRGDQFTLSLVSHLLFLYEDQLDHEFHKRMLLELLRVTSGEVRIFPLVNFKGEKSSLVFRLIEDRDFSGAVFEIRKTAYEFIKNGNEVLVVRK